MIARLESDVERSSAGAVAGGFESDDFGVVAPVILMKTFADDFTVAAGVVAANDDAADRGIGTGEADAFARESERMFHEANVVVSYGRGHGWGKRQAVTARVKKDSA
jgi:hypothetical protein